MGGAISYSNDSEKSFYWVFTDANDNDARYIAEAINSLPELLSYIETLEKRAEAGERLREQVEKVAIQCQFKTCLDEKEGNDCYATTAIKQRDAAIAAYDQAVKE